MNPKAIRPLYIMTSLLILGSCGPTTEQAPNVSATESLTPDAESAAEVAYRNAVNPPPSNWTGPVFQLSHDYPETLPLPPAGGYPWEQFDFKTQPSEYMYAALNYARRDLEDVDWDPTALAQPNWFHAPWMAFGNDGSKAREFIHGMTKERYSRRGDLSPQQTNDSIANVAIGFYNDVGGWTFGQVWKDPGNPNIANGAANFLNGAMAIKLLFTRADPAVPGDGVDYLRGSKEWQANMSDFSRTTPPPPRDRHTVRLLQVDIAIRDQRNDDLTGWLFGTFVYNATAPGAGPLDRLVPVGLMWGDSPGFTPSDLNAGRQPPEQWINESVQSYQHYGWARRVNGPVDSPTSSCISCHGGNAQDPYVGPMSPPNTTPPMPDSQKLAWFTNIKSGTAKNPGSVSLDYSLQMGVAIGNWKRWDQSPDKALEASLPAIQHITRGETED